MAALQAQWLGGWAKCGVGLSRQVSGVDSECRVTDLAGVDAADGAVSLTGVAGAGFGVMVVHKTSRGR